MTEQADVLIFPVAYEGVRGIAGALEGGGLRCTAQSRPAFRRHLEDGDCRCALLVLGPSAPVDDAVLAQIAPAAARGLPVRCVYEAGAAVQPDLAGWQAACPAAFRKPAVAISRYFPHDSGRLVLATALGELATKVAGNVPARLSAVGDAGPAGNVRAAPAGQPADDLPRAPSQDVVLEVFIAGAKGLRGAEWVPGTGSWSGSRWAGLGGQSDPFCSCEISGKPRSRVETRTAHNTLNPAWNFEAALEGYVAGDSLEFAVWDRDLFDRQDFLGRAVLRSSQFHPAGFEGELKLEDTARGVEAHLKVKVRAWRPSSDRGDFSELAGVEGLRWLAFEFLASETVAALGSGTWPGGLPAEHFRAPAGSRPLYVSYPPEDPQAPAPSSEQLRQLRAVLWRLPGGGSVGVPDRGRARGRSASGLIAEPVAVTLAEAILLSEVIVLDKTGPNARDHTPYLDRGQCFIEATAAVLTERFHSCRDGQLEELDLAIGNEVEPGVALRQLIRGDSDSIGMVFNRLCVLAQMKAFASAEDRNWWINVFRRMLQRHPVLQTKMNKKLKFAMECVSTDSFSWTSFQPMGAEISDKWVMQVSNDSIKLMIDEDVGDASGACIDWSKPADLRRLKEVCKLTRSLFNAFEDAEPETEGGLSRPVSAGGNSIDRSRCLRLCGRAAASSLRRLAYSDGFALFFVLVTFYALYAPDVMAACGFSTQNTPALAGVNTAVLALFMLEALVNCVGVEGYLFSGRFFLDIFAMVSFVGDTIVGNEIIPTDAAVAGRGSRLFGVVRVSGRASRIVGTVRLARMLRILQMLRIIHTIMWRDLLRPQRSLALLLLHKRLWRVFQDLDTRRKDRLSQEEIELFSAAMRLEFRDQVDVPRTMTGLTAQTRARPGSRKPTFFSEGRLSLFSRSSAHRRSLCDGTFGSIVHDFLARPEGKRALGKCEDDVKRVRASCSLVQRISGPVALKICVIVLAVLAVLPILEVSIDDNGDLEGLLQIGAVAGGVSAQDMCLLIKDYAQRSDHQLLFLAIGGEVPWAPWCECCDSPQTVPPEILEQFVAQGFWRSLSSRVMESTGLQPHELVRFCYPGADCSGTPEGVAVFDQHEAIRSEAWFAIMYTSFVVLLMAAFALFFTNQLNQINTRMLHPLWNILDDMASLRSLEVVRMARFQPAGRLHETSSRCTGCGCCHARGCRLLRCRRLVGEDCAWPLTEQMPDAVELVELRRSLTSMRRALRSWSKYVPPYILKSLYRSGVEASIGVCPRDVCVLFCDIDGFRAACKGLEPKGVLRMLSRVQGEVCDAVDRAGGTVLEFVGDEVLAIFNAPVDLPGYEEHAMSAAADAWNNTRKMGVRLRCGVHAARVLVGNIGSPTRMKYGVLGDGVNVSARLKSLNSHLGTQCLVSDAGFSFEGAHKMYLARPVGHLVLKGRKTPTKVWEVLGRRQFATAALADAFDKHGQAFQLYLERKFSEAMPLFAEVHSVLSGGWVTTDHLAQHYVHLCAGYMREPPPDDWDGTEKLEAK